MTKAISVEEAKRLYHESRNSSGREFPKIILINGDMMEYVIKTKWTSKEQELRDYEKIENAGLIFNGGY